MRNGQRERSGDDAKRPSLVSRYHVFIVTVVCAAVGGNVAGRTRLGRFIETERKETDIPSDGIRIVTRPDRIFLSVVAKSNETIIQSRCTETLYIYIFIIFVDNDESWQSYNRRLFARVPTILTPNYLIRVRVRARRIFPTQWKGGKARGGEVIADGSGLGLARGSVVRRYRVVWSPEDRMIAVWKRKEKNAFAGKWRIFLRERKNTSSVVLRAGKM